MVMPKGAASQTGTITGTVIDAGSNQPLSAAQIAVPEFDRGALTQANGNYLLPNMPVGTYQIEAIRIGFATARQQVTVTAGGTARVDFRLSQQALNLDEIVVTGTAGQARRREVGNTIAQVTTADIPEAVTGVESLLTGRTTGMSINLAGPSPSEAAVIRLRGISSTSQGNSPLIYVDGIRVEAEGVPNNVPGIGLSTRSPQSIGSTIGGINPADIERIEIIKGPAATTLYGTDAATGVIQIFTKRGTPGAASWTFETQQGYNESVKFSPEPEPYYYMDRVMRKGYRGTYNLSVQGGTGGVSYFVSGNTGTNEGILENDRLESSSLRGNFRFEPRPDLALEFNTGYNLSDIQEAPSGHNSQGLGGNTTRCPGGCTLGATWEQRIDSILAWEITQKNQHVMSGVTANWTPTQNFTHRVTLGINHFSSDQRNIRPFGFIFEKGGNVASTKWFSQNKTFDYVGSYALDATPSVAVTLSAGGQYQNTQEALSRVSSVGLPGPGVPTANSGATIEGFDSRSEVISAGFFGQALVGFRDRYFVTVGLRMDGYSAFGSNLGLEPYPKVSGSYVISDEPFWSPSLGSMKLRAAYGWAGRAPGAFDAVRTWGPANILGQAGLTTNNVGNADLGPERSNEIEVGFDSEYGEGRVAVEFTYYRRTTTDALFSVRQAPSGGWGGSQLENVGEIRNEGFEVGVNGDILRSEMLTWSAGVNLSTNKSKVVSLGAAPSFSTGSFTQIIEGQPAPVVIGSRLTNANLDAVEAPVWEDDYVWGPNYPTRIINMNTSFRLPKGIVLSARGEYQGGAYLWNRGLQVSTVRDGAWFCLTNGPAPYGGAYDRIAAGQVDQLSVRVRVKCNSDDIPDDAEISRGDFFKMRDISLMLPLPVNYFGVQVREATLTISGSNWIRWIHSDFFAFEPEIGDSQGPDDLSRATTGDAPPPKTLTAALRFRF
jgi:TonB-dependent SusC/RagA subfamily outer membrane receptor